MLRELDVKKSTVRRFAAVLAFVGLAVLLTVTATRRLESPQAPAAVTTLAPVPSPAALPGLAPEEQQDNETEPAAHEATEVVMGLPSRILRSDAGVVRAGNDLCTQEFT